MRKNNSIINFLLGTIIITFLVVLFYLTQKTYMTLIRSNEAVIQTGNIINQYQKVSDDFKNVIIYISTDKDSPSQAYLYTYGKGLWDIGIDMEHLKKLVNTAEKAKLDSLSKQIKAEVESINDGDPVYYRNRNVHIKNISAIQSFFDTGISDLQRKSISDVKIAQHSLVRLHDWIIALIVSTSIVIVLSLLLISKQFRKTKLQNDRLREIAWMQSHKVRAQVASLLGLGQLYNHHDPADTENNLIINNIVITAQKLDEIVKEINEKTDVS